MCYSFWVSRHNQMREEERKKNLSSKQTCSKLTYISTGNSLGHSVTQINWHQLAHSFTHSAIVFNQSYILNVTQFEVVVFCFLSIFIHINSVGVSGCGCCRDHGVCGGGVGGCMQICVCVYANMCVCVCVWLWKHQYRKPNITELSHTQFHTRT